MTHGKQGLITLSVLPKTSQDTTMRLHKALKNSHILFSANLKKTIDLISELDAKKVGSQ